MAELDLNSTGIVDWPKDKVTPACVKLELYANKIKKVPPSIGECTKLEVLNLFNNQIGLSLPTEIGTLTELTEVNIAANKLAMLKDVHFSGWGKVTVLNLNDNNLSAIGSLAPMVSLEELRIFANQLGALPTLASSMPELKIMELHKNRITTEGAPDEYFKATPALERLSIWKNALTALPSSLTSCAKLVGVQAQENPDLASLPSGPWPSSLETLFIQETKITALPDSLKACALKRVNVGKLNLDSAADALAGAMEKMILGTPDGIWWGKDGQMKRA